jgi:Protein of unknown function (DUF1353)
MQPGFQTNSIRVMTSDGLHDVILDPITFVTKGGTIYRVPEGSTTDGFSVPRCLQNIVPATGGSWMSACQHDASYRDQLEVWSVEKQGWTKAHLTQKQSDDLLLEALESQGVNWLMRHTIYRALRMFGSKAFNEDRTKVLPG